MFCGVDIIEVERIKDAITNTKGFLERVYTKREIEIGEKKKGDVKYQYYAGRFAAKEAIYKALSGKFGVDVWIKDIEILNDDKNFNRPYVTILKDNINKLQNDNEIYIDVSISHIKDVAIASANVEIRR